MPNVRRVKPQRPPETLAEMLLEIDEQLEGGDALCAVEVSGPSWCEMVERAEQEKEAERIRGRPAAGWVEASMPSELRASMARVAELESELARAHQLQSEATMQAERDAKRADANAAELSAALAEVGPLRAFRAAVFKVFNVDDVVALTDDELIANCEKFGTRPVHVVEVFNRTKGGMHVSVWRGAGGVTVELADGGRGVEFLQEGFKLVTPSGERTAIEAEGGEPKTPDFVAPFFAQMIDAAGALLSDADGVALEFDDRQAAVNCARREGWQAFRVVDANDKVTDLVGSPPAEPGRAEVKKCGGYVFCSLPKLSARDIAAGHTLCPKCRKHRDALEAKLEASKAEPETQPEAPKKRTRRNLITDAPASQPDLLP